MHFEPAMVMRTRSLTALLLILSVSCATTSTTSTTWVDPGPGGNWARPGRVESVQEVVQRVEGNPAGGAIAGALIGGLLFGGRAEFSQPTPDSARRAADILRRGMETIFPELTGRPIDYSWGGNVAFTRDQLPHAGRLHGAFYAGGYCGHGVAMATYLGALVARRMSGERPDHPLFDDHFRAIPFYHGTPWFLPIAGAYYKLLDWLR